MIINEIVTGIIAVVIGYLLGSIPSAYIAARLIKGKDIRRVGGGNVGTRNAFVEVGKGAGVAVGISDIGKGAAAVAIAHWLLAVPLFEVSPFILLTGVAAVVGHIWPIYLKFSGGNGLATTIGTLTILMPRELLIVIALIILLTGITRNIILSVNISLLSVPLSAWLLGEPGLLIIFPLLLLLIMALHFLPTAKATITKAGSSESLSAELLRRDKGKKEEK